MTRPRTASTLISARVALSLVALVSAGCSFSFRSGSGTSNEAGKPAIRDGEQPSATKPTSKPIAKADPEAPATPAEPAATEPDEGTDPTRTPPPAEDPPPVVEPKLTAVCRTQDSTLESLCHRALDPIAADDLDAWASQLDEQVVVTRPTYRKGMQRVEGPERVRGLADRAGGLRALLHLRPTDCIVGTVANDCRQCRRAVVVFEANTRSGTITVELEMTQPPAIVVVDVGSHMRRRHLEELKQRRPAPTEDRPQIAPPAEPDPVEPGGDVVPPKKPVLTKERPEPEAKPKLEAKPKAEAKPKLEAKPKEQPKKEPTQLIAPKDAQ